MPCRTRSLGRFLHLTSSHIARCVPCGHAQKSPLACDPNANEFYDSLPKGNYAKFSQNIPLRDYLLSTGNKVLVEASPYDDIWGIALSANNPDAKDPRKWRGQNLLGFALMEVRDMIRHDVEAAHPHDSEPTPEEKNALKFWTMGLGNMAKAFAGEDPMPDKSVIASADSWKTLPMPENHVIIPMNEVIPTKAMRIVQRGHIPEAMEDHWFMYCDDSTIRYYRSWTGICVFEARYEICGENTEITSLRINREIDPDGNNLKDAALFMALMITDAGGNASVYWNFALS